MKEAAGSGFTLGIARDNREGKGKALSQTRRPFSVLPR